MNKKHVSLAVGLLFLSLLMVMTVPSSFAADSQTVAIVSNTATIQTTPVATDAGMMANSSLQKSDYTLPYPGILPNHPLYFIKKIRDQIIEMLVVDPLRKSEFYLLQSDKLLSAAVLLEQNGTIPVAQASLDESSTRMTMAVGQLTTLKQSGRDVPAGSIDRMGQALQKHLEVLDDVAAKKTVDTTAARTALLKAQDDLGKLK